MSSSCVDRGRAVLDEAREALTEDPELRRFPAGSLASDQVMIDGWLMLLRTVSETARLAAARTPVSLKKLFGIW